MIFKKYNPKKIKDIDSIAIIMFGLMGDVLIRTPVIRALNDIFPNAKITALVDPIGKIVLEHNPYISNIIVFDRKKEKNKLNQILKKVFSILKIRKQKFDLIVNLYNGGMSRYLVLLSKAKYKLGFCLKENRFLYNVKNECNKNRLNQFQSYYSYMISIIESFTSKQYPLRPIFQIFKSDQVSIKQYLNSFSYDPNKLYILNLASGGEEKMLEFEKYFDLVFFIYKNYDFIPAILSNPNQEHLQETFINKYLKNSQIPYIKLKKLNLGKVAAIIKNTNFVITPDTGILHLSFAIKANIFAIFTYTNPLLVDIDYKNYTAIYEKFNNYQLFKKQNITKELLIEKFKYFIQNKDNK